MTITPTTLIRGSALAAAAAGCIFFGVQISHPPMEPASVGTAEWALRNTLKVVMAVLALAGITGMYARMVRPAGLLGLIGYLLFSTGYVAMLVVAAIGAFVLPATIRQAPAYVTDVLELVAGGAVRGDLGLLPAVNVVQAIGYLAGGLVFGIALLRAGVLHRWAAALLITGAVATLLVPVLPHSIDRLLAYPTAVALVGLGWSLWRRAEPTATEAWAAAPDNDVLDANPLTEGAPS